MEGAPINVYRWLFYLAVGTPALAWLFLTRNNVLRLLALLFVSIFIESIFTARRQVLGVGIGAENILLYVALVGVFVQGGRTPPLGYYLAAWGALLTCAVGSLVIGTGDTTSFAANLRAFQELYFEGFLFFLLGLACFRRDQEVDRFFFLLVVGIVTVVGLSHLYASFAGIHLVGTDLYDPSVGSFGGGVFGNPNSISDFYVMTLPVAMLITLRSGRPLWQRSLVAASIVLILASLLVASSRGGLLLAAVMTLVALLWRRGGLVRGFGLGLAGVMLLALGYAIASVILADYLGAIFGKLSDEGLETGRFGLWRIYLGIVLANPFGVGVGGMVVKAASAPYGGTFSTAHNIYLDHALRAGLLGLMAFLALLLPVVLGNLRALRGTRDALRYRVLSYLFFAVNGFLIAGIIEPIYVNGYKLNHLFWLLVGISLAASARAPEAKVQPVPSRPQHFPSPWSPSHG